MLRNFLEYSVLQIEFIDLAFNFLSAVAQPGPCRLLRNLLEESGWPADLITLPVHSAAHQAQNILILSALVPGPRWAGACGRLQMESPSVLQG